MKDTEIKNTEILRREVNLDVKKENESQKVEDLSNLSLSEIVTVFEEKKRRVGDKIFEIKEFVEEARMVFKQKQDLIEKEQQEIYLKINDSLDEFSFSSPECIAFDKLYQTYRNKLKVYNQNYEKILVENHNARIEVIEELKEFINTKESLDTTYKNFKKLQKKWKDIGPVSKNKNEDTWRTYRHNVELFYDYLDLNREFRDLDFKRNLELKEALIKKAEGLLEEKNPMSAFRKLQQLHKTWKQEIGPVPKDKRESIWEKFSNITKEIHQRRQAYLKQKKEEDKIRVVQKIKLVENLKKLILDIDKYDSHTQWQTLDIEVEDLKKTYFKLGKGIDVKNEDIWVEFKVLLRKINKTRVSFYKQRKEKQNQIFEKKQELIVLMDNYLKQINKADFVQEVIKVQQAWKLTGKIYRKDAQALWETFKGKCDQFFEQLKTKQNIENEQVLAKNYETKQNLLQDLKAFNNTADEEVELVRVELVKIVQNWRGKVTQKNKDIEKEFLDTLIAICEKHAIPKNELNLFIFKFKTNVNLNNEFEITKEKRQIENKLDKLKSEINMLEYNMVRFSTSDNSFFDNIKFDLAKKEQHRTEYLGQIKHLNWLLRQ